MQIPSISFPILYNPSTNILSKQNHNHFSIPKVPLLSLHMNSLLNPSSSEGIIVKSITPYVQRTCESNSNGIDQRKNNRTKSEATNELVTWFTSSPGHVEGCGGTHKMCPHVHVREISRSDGWESLRVTSGGDDSSVQFLGDRLFRLRRGREGHKWNIKIGKKESGI